MKMKYTITTIVLASENINISYSLLDGMVTGRITIPFKEFTDDRMKEDVLSDITSRKESILAIRDIVDKWKGQELEAEIV